MKVHVLSQQDFHTTHERLASYRIVDQLRKFAGNTEDVWVFQNVRLHAVEEIRRDGSKQNLNPCEPDLIIVKRTDIMVVEMKHWGGRITWPQTNESMRDPWHRIQGKERVEICEGYRSPLSQVWYNRRVLQAHLRARAGQLPTEAARTSDFSRIGSMLLFTDDGVSFERPKPEFWRNTILSTLAPIQHATSFAEAVAATTTRRRDHKSDHRHEIELSDDDIDYLIDAWELRPISESSIASAIESNGPQTMPEIIKSRLYRMPTWQQEMYRETLPLKEMEGKPLPIRLISFYTDLLEREARSQPDINLTPVYNRKFYLFNDVLLEDLVSDNGVLIPAEDLPSWQGTEELSIGVYLLGEGTPDRLSARPLFTLAAEISPAENVNGKPMRTIRVIDTSRCEINRSALRKLAVFKNFEDDEIAALVSTIEELEGSYEQITALIRRIHGDVKDFTLSSLPKHGGEATFCAVLFAPKQIFTKNLIEDLQQIREKWESNLQEGETPDDLAWRFLSEPEVLGSKSNWNPPKTSILPLNYEQSLAASMVYDGALPIGVVSGPPGTGKSALICNVLAEAYERKQTVLFASYNNGAVDVVTKKINDEILRLPLVVGLGSSVRTKETTTALQQHSISNTITAEQLSKETREATDTIRSVNGRLRDLYREYQSYLQDTAEETQLYRLLDDALNKQPLGLTICSFDPDRLSEFAANLRKWAETIFTHNLISEHIHSFFQRIKATSKGWVGALAVFSKRRFERDARVYYDLLVNDTISYSCLNVIQSVLYHVDREVIQQELLEISEILLRLKELQEKIAGKTESKYLKQWEELERERIVPSRKLLTARARHNVSTFGTSWARSIEFQGPIPQETVNGMQVVSTTSLSVRRKLSLNVKFDILIIDEASQSTIASVLPLLFRAKRAIIIGDDKQLQPVVTTEEHVYCSRLRAYRLIHDNVREWIDQKSSILSLALYHIRDRSPAYVMLRDHFRCHPDIIGFSNTEFYEGLLRIRTDISQNRPGAGMHWISSRGNEIDKVNENEVDIVIGEVRRLLESGIVHEQIGIVTPFRAQKEAIQRRLKNDQLRDGSRGSIDVDTAHGFQGREKDVMLYSLVVTGKSSFGRRQWSSATVDASHLINVAVTRARQQLIVIGDPDGVIGYTHKLMRWCENRNRTFADDEIL